MANVRIGDKTVRIDGFEDMTPDEQLATVNEIEAMLNGPPEPTLEERGDTMMRQGASGMNEGLANVAGAPVDLATTIANIPSSFSNVVNRGINAAFGTDFQTDRQLVDPDTAVGGSEWIKSQGEKDISVPLPFTDAEIGVGPMIYPEVEGHETARKTGEYVGTGIGTLMTMGAGGASGVKTGVGVVDDIAQATAKELATRPVATLSKEAAASAAAIPGGKAGGDLAVTIADAVGAEDPEAYRTTGEGVGELVTGAGTAAALESINPARLMSSIFGSEDSATILAAADRLNVKPSAGLVGNQGAAYVENTAGLNPLSSRDVTSLQSKQVEQVGDAAKGVTDDLRAPSGAAPADTAYSAGAQVRQAGDDAYVRLQRELGDLTTREMDSLGGPEAALRIDRTREAIENAMPRLTPAQQKEMTTRLGELEQMRIKGWERMGANQQHRVPQGTPVDPELDTQIRTRLEKRITRLDELEARAGSTRNPLTAAEKREARNLRHRIKVDIAQIDNNIGVSNQQMNAWRKELGQELPNRGTVGSQEQRETYAGIRDDQRIKAAQEGQIGEFAEVTGEKARLSGGTPLEEGGDAKFLKDLTQSSTGTPKEPQAVWNFLMQKDAAGRIEAYRRNVSPEEFSATMGNMIDMMAVPRSQGARAGTMNTEDFTPKKFLTQWKNLPKETQEMLYETADVQQRVKDIETLSQALAARGTASNPSGTTATAIIAKIMGEGARSPLITMLTLTANKGAARAFMSEPVARAISAQYPKLYEEMVRELPQAAMRSTIEDEDE